MTKKDKKKYRDWFILFLISLVAIIIIVVLGIKNSMLLGAPIATAGISFIRLLWFTLDLFFENS